MNFRNLNESFSSKYRPKLIESYVEEWWGEVDENPYEFAKEFNLSVNVIDTRLDETRYRFSGSKEDIDRAKDAGYFYSLDYDDESEESIDEDVDSADFYSSEFLSDVYNALSDVMFKHRDENITSEDMDKAMEWFSTHFFVDAGYDE